MNNLIPIYALAVIGKLDVVLVEMFRNGESQTQAMTPEDYRRFTSCLPTGYPSIEEKHVGEHRVLTSSAYRITTPTLAQAMNKITMQLRIQAMASTLPMVEPTGKPEKNKPWYQGPRRKRW